MKPYFSLLNIKNYNWELKMFNNYIALKKIQMFVLFKILNI